MNHPIINAGDQDVERALTGWLGLAIISITFHNAGTFFHARPIPTAVASTLFNAGWVGIPLLAVLFGFIATRVLSDGGEMQTGVGWFYGRVLRRTAPIYYLTIFVAFLVLPLVIESGAWTDSVARDQLWYWTLLRNWAPGPGANISGFQHTWALAAAWPVLLIWPLVVRYGGVVGVAVAVFVALGWKIFAFVDGATAPEVYHTTIAWVDGIALGSLAAFGLRDPEWRSRTLALARPLFLLVSLGLGAVVLEARGFSAGNLLVVEVGAPLIDVWFATLIVGSVAGPSRLASAARRLLGLSWLQVVGRYCFAIYLLHFPLHLAITQFVPDPVAAPLMEVLYRLGYDAVVLLVSTLVAMALWWGIERGRRVFAAAESDA